MEALALQVSTAVLPGSGVWGSIHSVFTGHLNVQIASETSVTAGQALTPLQAPQGPRAVPAVQGSRRPTTGCSVESPEGVSSRLCQ